jgi:hypothetical protein
MASLNSKKEKRKKKKILSKKLKI